MPSLLYSSHDIKRRKKFLERNKLLLGGKEEREFVKLSMVTFQLIIRFHEPYSSHKGGKSQVTYSPAYDHLIAFNVGGLYYPCPG